jgi:hypothetical protein
VPAKAVAENAIVAAAAITIGFNNFFIFFWNFFPFSLV